MFNKTGASTRRSRDNDFVTNVKDLLDQLEMDHGHGDLNRSSTNHRIEDIEDIIDNYKSSRNGPYPGFVNNVLRRARTVFQQVRTPPKVVKPIFSSSSWDPPVSTVTSAQTGQRNQSTGSTPAQQGQTTGDTTTQPQKEGDDKTSKNPTDQDNKTVQTGAGTKDPATSKNDENKSLPLGWWVIIVVGIVGLCVILIIVVLCCSCDSEPKAQAHYIPNPAYYEQEERYSRQPSRYEHRRHRSRRSRRKNYVYAKH